MKKKCLNCNGTGWEDCEVHGKHLCKSCDGEGCVDDCTRIPKRYNPWPYDPYPNPWKPNKWEIWCGRPVGESYNRKCDSTKK